MIKVQATILLVVVGALLAVPARGQTDRPLLVPERIYSAEAVLAAAQSEVDPASDLGATPQPKSGKLAMLFSLVLPGTGELYLGAKGRAAGFLVAEGLIWTSYFVFEGQGAHREDLYKEFAHVHAGVAPREDDDYYRIIGNFIGSDGPFSANEQVRREARAIFPNDREKQEEYVQENSYQGGDTWQWDSSETFDRYREMRSSSQDSYENANLSLGLLVANRILSVIDVGLISAGQHREYKKNQTTVSWNVRAERKGPAATVIVSRTF
jgi:hypothetical protein